jgi:hypothetical protein
MSSYFLYYRIKYDNNKNRSGAFEIGQYFSRVVTDNVPPPLALFLGALKSSSLNYVVIKFRLKIW